MIHIVTQENRRLYHRLLTQMHEQRKIVFIDQMRWALDECAGLEMDEFDRADAIYLIETKSGRVVQSARLLPSTDPHLLSEVFADLCEGGVPRGASIWEASRFCPAPSVEKGKPRQELLFRMIAAILEAGLLFGIDQVTFVASAALRPLAMNAGWRVAALGPSRRSGRDRLTAFAANVDVAGLRAVRARNAIDTPVTRFAAPAHALAA